MLSNDTIASEQTMMNALGAHADYQASLCEAKYGPLVCGLAKALCVSDGAMCEALVMGYKHMTPPIAKKGALFLHMPVAWQWTLYLTEAIAAVDYLKSLEPSHEEVRQAAAHAEEAPTGAGYSNPCGTAYIDRSSGWSNANAQDGPRAEAAPGTRQDA